MKNGIALPMNRPSPNPSQEGNCWKNVRLPSSEGLGVGSWSQCVRESEWWLSMNSQSAWTQFVLHMQHNIGQFGSWSQCASKSEWWPMNRTPSPLPLKVVG